jgi:hypothetical protein
LQGTFGTIQGTFGAIQGTCGTIQGTFGTIQGTFGTIQGTFGQRYKIISSDTGARPILGGEIIITRCTHWQVPCQKALPFFIVFLNFLMHFDFPSIYFGFLFENPFDRLIRSSKVLILENFGNSSDEYFYDTSVF